MKLNKEQLQEFIEISDKLIPEYPTWRKGQLYFNVLSELHPELAEEIRGSLVDPFHIQERLPAFFKYITE